MTDSKASRMRAALERLPGTSFSEQPELENIYFPQSHLKAMHPDVAIVTGMRGAGKTFWCGALQLPAVCKLLGKRHERTGISKDTVVRTGFGATLAVDEYPSKHSLADLIRRETPPRLVWRTVQAWQLAPKAHPMRQQENWRGRVKYVGANPEQIDRLFAERDAKLAREGRHVVMIYDALDRSADNWRTMYRIVRGLLQTALDMRGYRHIRVKVFLRTDQFDPPAIGDFPDASKVLATAAELSWPRHELYGLLWHLLGNAPQPPAALHELIGEERTKQPSADGDDTWQVPASFLFDEARQRQAFHAIAGEWMGTDRRRGFPYTWIPNHLGDTDGKVSPRSFIAAIREAAEDSGQQHPRHEYALHYESIKRGVQKASLTRVDELREDYPWADRLLEDLRGCTVPCPFREVESRWTSRQTLTRLREEVEHGDVKLPPRLEEGVEGIRADLESLSIFQRVYDGRVNIPDVFRVGYGLGRRGGVRRVR